VNILQRLTVAATAAAAFALASASPCSATEPAKQPAKTEPAKTPPQKTQPAAVAPVATPPAGHALQQLTTIHAQDPAGPAKTNTFRPNQEMRSSASAGWDSKATDKGVVKLPASKPVDPKVLAAQENKKLKDEQLKTAQRYPATGKAPPAPKSVQTDSAPGGFFSRLLGK
jgi:hypothetical protein